MLDRKTNIAARPHLAADMERVPRIRKHSIPICARAMMTRCAGWIYEAKSMSTAVNSDGGYLVDPQTSDSVASMLNSTASIRSIASRWCMSRRRRMTC